jgi:hypothetical protein
VAVSPVANTVSCITHPIRVGACNCAGVRRGSLSTAWCKHTRRFRRIFSRSSARCCFDAGMHLLLRGLLRGRLRLLLLLLIWLHVL